MQTGDANLNDEHYQLLDEDEPGAVVVERPDSESPYLFVCDHYGNRIPRKLGTLGVKDADLQRHIAWDVGVAGMAEEFARRFDATLVKQEYSRLVIDCNRPLDSATSIPEISEDTEIPGNRGISEEEVAARRREIFTPYHDTIASILDRRLAAVDKQSAAGSRSEERA